MYVWCCGVSWCVRLRVAWEGLRVAWESRDGQGLIAGGRRHKSVDVHSRAGCRCHNMSPESASQSWDLDEPRALFDAAEPAMVVLGGSGSPRVLTVELWGGIRPCSWGTSLRTSGVLFRPPPLVDLIRILDRVGPQHVLVPDLEQTAPETAAAPGCQRASACRAVAHPHARDVLSGSPSAYLLPASPRLAGGGGARGPAPRHGRAGLQAMLRQRRQGSAHRPQGAEGARAHGGGSFLPRSAPPRWCWGRQQRPVLSGVESAPAPFAFPPHAGAVHSWARLPAGRGGRWVAQQGQLAERHRGRRGGSPRHETLGRSSRVVG